VDKVEETLAAQVEKVDIKDTGNSEPKETSEPKEVSKEITESKEDPKENALTEQDQDENTSVEVTCAYCKKPSPSKRCSKRHPKCLKKMFCNESCETLSHKKKETGAVAKKEDSKLAAKKKKKAKENRSDFGAMWWLNQEC